jgi:NADH-quinone oxidoreductase subunit J
MEFLTASNIIFVILSVTILFFGVMMVTETKILRSATYLFFVLFGVAGLYLQMNYEFLAAVQLSVYAGGIVVLFIFAILLIKGLGEEKEKNSKQKSIMGAIAAFSGLALSLITIFKYKFVTADFSRATEITSNLNMQQIGNTLMGTEKHQYLLPFEASSILLLACIIGGLVVAQINKEDRK